MLPHLLLRILNQPLQPERVMFLLTRSCWHVLFPSPLHRAKPCRLTAVGVSPRGAEAASLVSLTRGAGERPFRYAALRLQNACQIGFPFFLTAAEYFKYYFFFPGENNEGKGACLLAGAVSSAVTASLRRHMFVDFALLLHKYRSRGPFLGAGGCSFSFRS